MYGKFLNRQASKKFQNELALVCLTHQYQIIIFIFYQANKENAKTTSYQTWSTVNPGTSSPACTLYELR